MAKTPRRCCVRNCGVRRISAPPCAASAPTAHRESTRRAMSARAPSCLAQGPPNFLCRGPTCFDALCFAFCENGTERGIRSILLTGAALCASPYDAFDPMLLARCQSRNRLAVVNLRAAPMTALQFFATFCRCLEPVLALDPLSTCLPNYRHPSKRKGYRNRGQASSLPRRELRVRRLRPKWFGGSKTRVPHSRRTSHKYFDRCFPANRPWSSIMPLIMSSA